MTPLVTDCQASIAILGLSAMRCTGTRHQWTARARDSRGRVVTATGALLGEAITKLARGAL